MPSCAFKLCTNHSKNKNKESHGITYHSFPADEILKDKWLTVVREQRKEPYWTPTRHSRICCIHFKQEHLYATNQGRMRVTKEAVPSFQVSMETGSSAFRSSPNSLENVDISDCDHIFETPKEAYLSQKVKNLLEEKDKLLRENQNLRRRNKRLVSRCTFLKETVGNLKKKINRSQVRKVKKSRSNEFTKTDYIINIDGKRIERPLEQVKESH